MLKNDELYCHRKHLTESAIDNKTESAVDAGAKRIYDIIVIHSDLSKDDVSVLMINSL